MLQRKQNRVSGNGEGWGGRYTLFQTQELEKAILKKMPFKLKLSNQSLAKIWIRASQEEQNKSTGSTQEWFHVQTFKPAGQAAMSTFKSSYFNQTVWAKDTGGFKWGRSSGHEERG